MLSKGFAQPSGICCAVSVSCPVPSPKKKIGLRCASGLDTRETRVVANDHKKDKDVIRMKIQLLGLGLTSAPYIKQGIALYQDRIKRYLPFETKFLPDPKLPPSPGISQRKQVEGQLLLKHLPRPQQAILLDEKGETMTSRSFAQFLQHRMNSSVSCLTFVIGGPFGFSPEVYAAVPKRLSFSKMTMAHDLIRLVVVEQLYRAMTILRNEPYHHD